MLMTSSSGYRRPRLSRSSSYNPGYCGTTGSYRSGGGGYGIEYDALDYRRQPYSGGGRRRGGGGGLGYDFTDHEGPFF